MASQPSQTARWVSLNEAADYIGVHFRTLRRMIREGQIPAHRVGNRIIRLNLNEVDAALKPVKSVVNL